MTGSLATKRASGGRSYLGIFGFIGSFAPSIVKMFNQLPNLAFIFRWEWIAVIVLYGLLGALIAIIYPYKGRPSPWRALLLGCSFPALIGVGASLVGPSGAGGHLGGNDIVHWSAWDFITLY